MADTIIIRADRFCASIYPNMLPEHTITKLRKIFMLMFRYDYENQEAIRDMSEAINKAVATAKMDLDHAICEYRTGFVNPERCDSKKAAKAARAKNRKLLQVVRSAERYHERWQKIQSAWSATKQKCIEKGIYYG